MTTESDTGDRNASKSPSSKTSAQAPVNGHSRHHRRATSELQQKKLTQLENLLLKASSSHSTDKQTEFRALSNNLFAKAQEEFLSQRTSEELLTITETLNSAIHQFLEEDEERYLVQLQAEESSSPLTTAEIHIEETAVRLFVVLGDRPFIYNSMRECILQSGGTIEAFLHPILLREGQRLSCSYIALRDLSLQQAEILKKDLERSFDHVLAATDDFTSMLVRVETLARVYESERSFSFFTPREQTEAAHLLRWLTDGGFLFMGLTTWEPHKIGEHPTHVQASLGVHGLDSSYGRSIREELVEDIQQLEEQDEIIAVSRLRAESHIQRRSQMLNFTLLEPSADGTRSTCYQITGLLTSKSHAEESSSVPYLRRKLQAILEIEGALEQSHDHKNIVNIFNSMPKEESFRLDVESLSSVVDTILNIQNKNETRVSVRFDKHKRHASVLIVMPRDRFNTSVRHLIQEYVEGAFHTVPGSSEYFLDLSNKPHARFYFHIPVPKGGLPDLNIAQLKTDIAELTRGWRENMEERVRNSVSFSDPLAIWNTYSHAFTEGYQTLQSIDDCEHDISQIERFPKDYPIQVSMRPSEEDVPGSFVLVVYKKGEDLTISYALPILENAGLEVLNERAFHIRPLRKEKISIHRFLVRTKSGAFLSQETFETFLAPGLEKVFNGEAKNDLTNSLLISANLDIDAIALLRTYCSLLWQINKFASKSIILKALTSVPAAARQLWNMFEIRFNPDFESSRESRQQRFTTTLSTFQDSLRDVSDITTDRILRSLANLLKHTVRTNYYRSESTIALKIHSEKIAIIPTPRPKYEIFVRSQHLEGVHLRAGDIARGGIRWSDRHQDFRQEILDLCKTQNIKNSLIVPVGAKGGFVVKNLPTAQGDQRRAVESAYKEFIRALLSVTDNRVGAAVAPPDRVISYDGEDPYFVVAADKGTATFSDVANTIAIQEYNFWLGDAFASGGSDGYDHKLYGITAKGAWQSVRRHFINLGIDHNHTPFTVVGIGDMSGDVFGNGLIESNQIRLIAAFNHQHIFLDPDPDPQTSFEERTRLFCLPRSSWADYSKEIISRGGGVFERDSREIPLSSEIRQALDIPKDEPEAMDGEQLISHILQAPVDLLWNGGIGTYVKADFESHADVNDGTNDRVRINATELRAKVIGEGGNLGLTQKARIQFAKHGGCVNTDAIDNSGGVDLSDHEVNLKILFQGIMADGRITLADRNTMLRSVAPQIVDEVLRHNFNHALALTIGVQRSRRRIDYYKSLLRKMAKLGFVNRQIENLPDDEELTERSRKLQGLWIPELAVCISAVKRWVKTEIGKSRLTEDPLLATFLLEYFPQVIREKYSDDVLAHPLAANIISTQVTNELIDSLGVSFVHRMCLTHSTSPVNVIKSTLAADMIMKARSMREEVRHLESALTDDSQKTKTISERNILELLQELHDALRNVAAWFIGYHSQSTLKDIVECYKKGFQEIIASEGRCFLRDQQQLYHLRYEKYVGFGLSVETARTFATFPQMLVIMEILWTAKHMEAEVSVVSPCFSAVMTSLLADDALAIGGLIETKSKWESELLMGALRDMRRSLSLLTCQLFQEDIKDEKSIQRALGNHDAVADIRLLVEEMKARDCTVIELAVLARHLTDLPRLVLTR